MLPQHTRIDTILLLFWAAFGAAFLLGWPVGPSDLPRDWREDLNPEGRANE